MVAGRGERILGPLGVVGVPPSFPGWVGPAGRLGNWAGVGRPRVPGSTFAPSRPYQAGL